MITRRGEDGVLSLFCACGIKSFPLTEWVCYHGWALRMFAGWWMIWNTCETYVAAINFSRAFEYWHFPKRGTAKRLLESQVRWFEDNKNSWEFSSPNQKTQITAASCMVWGGDARVGAFSRLTRYPTPRKAAKAPLHWQSEGGGQLFLFLRPYNRKPYISVTSQTSCSAFKKSSGSSLRWEMSVFSAGIPPLRRCVQPQKSPKCFILPLPPPRSLAGTFLKVVSVRVSDTILMRKPLI